MSRPPAAADRCFRVAATSVLMEGIFGFLRESSVQCSGKPSLSADSRFLKFGWASLAVENRLSKSHGPLFASGQPTLNARADFRLQRDKLLSKLWGPGPLSSGPADGRKQAEFTSAVKRGGRRASLASVQRVQS